MTVGLMRRFTSRRLLALERRACLTPARRANTFTSLSQSQGCVQPLAQARDTGRSGLWSTDSSTLRSVDPNPSVNGASGRPPDERKLKLGKTIGILHDQLPTLLASPLPQEILSPQITLHLFPSTHPHLPTVSGRIAYSAALWTAPVVWGRVPVVGNVRLTILSERVVKNGTVASEISTGGESLVVRWKTCGRSQDQGSGALYPGSSAKGDQVDRITEILGGDTSNDKEFTGLFIFEFDDEGRIVTHTIEHAQQGGNWAKMTRFINVTDWLLGRARWKRSEDVPQLALDFEDGTGGRTRYGGRQVDG